MVELETDGDCRSIVTPTLRLAFRWVDDRWVHSIEPGRMGAPIARTIEGDPARDDPARVVSPAYQQLEFQATGLGLQALLVGQSGPHHFSAVFSVEESKGGTVIEADVADRCRTPIDVLACTYWVDARSGDLLDADSTRIQWSLPAGRLDFEVTPPGSAHLSEAGRRATRAQAGARVTPGTYTHRCRYRWRWQPNPPPLSEAGLTPLRV
jgi:hypothetical protein